MKLEIEITLFLLYSLFSVVVTVEDLREFMLNEGDRSDGVLTGGDAKSDKSKTELASSDGKVGELTRSGILLSENNRSFTALIKVHRNDPKAYDRIILESQTDNMYPMVEVDLLRAKNVDKLPKISKTTCTAEHIDIRAVPYIVVVHITSPGRRHPTICTGFFIHINWILTAAHCFDDVYFGTTEIKFGVNDYNLKTEYSVHPIQIIKHNHYIRKNNILFNDIALIKVSVPEAFSKHIAVVKVDENEWNSEQPRKCKGIGYGGMRSSGGGQFDTLLHVDHFVARRDHAGCGCFRNNRMYVCGKTDGPVETCFNDSGGPLLCNGQVVGLANVVLECDITARLNNSCSKESYYRYLYLCAYFDWISMFVDQFRERCKPHKPFLVLLSPAACLHPTSYLSLLFAIFTFIHTNL